MSLKKHVNNVWQDIDKLQKYSNGTWANCEFARKNQNGAWEDVWTDAIWIVKNGVVCNNAEVNSNFINSIQYKDGYIDIGIVYNGATKYNTLFELVTTIKVPEIIGKTIYFEARVTEGTETGGILQMYSINPSTGAAIVNSNERIYAGSQYNQGNPSISTDFYVFKAVITSALLGNDTTGSNNLKVTTTTNKAARQIKNIYIK